MKSLFRTVAAVTAIALSSFAAQAANPALTFVGKSTPTKVFDLLPGGSVSFDFALTSARQYFDLDIWDLGAPGDIFAVYLDGTLIADTPTVAAHNYATLTGTGSYTAATPSACRTKTVASTSISGNCQDSVITASNGFSFNEAGGAFNHFGGPGIVHLGVNTITIKSIQNDTVAGVAHDTLGAFKLICNDTCNVSTVPVPEPSTYSLVLAGLAGVGFLARRRRATV
jgi:hypothetical protein